LFLLAAVVTTKKAVTIGGCGLKAALTIVRSENWLSTDG